MGLSSFRMAREAEERGDARIENVDAVTRVTAEDASRAAANEAGLKSAHAESETKLQKALETVAKSKRAAASGS